MAELDISGSYFVGRSRALAEMLKQAALAASLDVPALLTGEPGTGKSRLARMIHDNSPRAAQPFVEVNCALLRSTLMEIELFGTLHFHTPDRPIEGKVAAAERGTLLLNEVAEVTPSAQIQLMHLLQSKEYCPIAATKPVHADVRIVAVTNMDLERAVAGRRFREDLFNRLQTLRLRVSSLAERREDIPELATLLCVNTCERLGLGHLELSRSGLRAVESAEWPGNIRQLAFAVSAAAIRASGEAAKQVEPTHLFPKSTA